MSMLGVADEHVEMIGGKYKGSRGRITGQTNDFLQLELEDGTICRSKRGNARMLSEAHRLELPLDSAELHTKEALGGQQSSGRKEADPREMESLGGQHCGKLEASDQCETEPIVGQQSIGREEAHPCEKELLSKREGVDLCKEELLEVQRDDARSEAHPCEREPLGGQGSGKLEDPLGAQPSSGSEKAEPPGKEPLGAQQGSGSEIVESPGEDCSQHHPTRAGVLGAHVLSVMTWNANKMSFFAKLREEMKDYVSCVAAEIMRQHIEVVVLQEVPKKQGPGRVEELRARLNETLLAAGVDEALLFQDPVFSPQSKSRDIHAMLLRGPLRLEEQLTLDEVDGVPFAYPALVAAIRDERFSFAPLQRIVLVSVHTPGSADRERVRQRVQEVNRLFGPLHGEVAQRLTDGDGLLFSDLRARRKAPSSGACATPFIVCGDLNVDLYKPDRGVPEDLRHELRSGGVELEPHPEMSRVMVRSPTGCWVAGAPAGKCTSSGGRCFDWFLWNADIAKRMACTVKPMHLSFEASKKPLHHGLSDHDAVVLELCEDVVHARQKREEAGRALPGK